MKKIVALGMHKRMHGENSVADSSFYNRLDKGRSIKEAIETPHQGHGGAREFPNLKGIFKDVRDGNISYPTFIKRVNEYFYE